MGMGFRLNLKWGISVQPTLSSKSSFLPSSFYCKSKDANYDIDLLSQSYITSIDSEVLSSDPLGASRFSFASQVLRNTYLGTEEVKITGDDDLAFLTSLQAYKGAYFRLLLENLNVLEDTFSDSGVVRLERDILVQFERLGALKLFHTFLSRTLNPTDLDLFDAPTSPEEPLMNDNENKQTPKVVVPSTKKEERKSRRDGVSNKVDEVSVVERPSKSNHKGPHHFTSSIGRKSRGRRPKITWNEAELSKGVNLVADLEKLKLRLEEETGIIINFSSWAMAAGVSNKELHESLHYGWCCRDEILKSTRSLVVYLAKNYGGKGVPFEDLIQAGKLGALQGAERFDQTKGYKFSTYAQYWIRKSMLRLMSRHARGIRVPFTLMKAINQIQKARKALQHSSGKFPDDDEIAKFTGLSLVKIASASKCLRIVGSIDEKIGDGISAKFLELTPDSAMKSPEETVMRQEIIKEVHDLLIRLNPIERKVLVFRFGLGGHQRKSLEDIGRLFGVSKEWIRKIERTALTKLKSEENLQNLRHYSFL